MIHYTMSNKGKLVSSKTNNSCLNSLLPYSKKNTKRGLKTRKTRRILRQEAKKRVMPPSTKEYFKNCMDISAPAWPQPERFDVYVAPAAPLNSTEYIMENYYEAERVLNEIVSTPDRLYENGRPFNSSGSMFGVVNLGAQVPTRCA